MRSPRREKEEDGSAGGSPGECGDRAKAQKFDLGQGAGAEGGLGWRHE